MTPDAPAAPGPGAVRGADPPGSTERSRDAREVCLAVGGDADIVAARAKGRRIATLLGFSATECTLIATVISELARNIVTYARRGEILIRPMKARDRHGVEIVARDPGPGIPDVEAALTPGFSTSGGLGVGLPGVRRVCDEFEIASEVGRGTTVRARKWTR